MTIANDVHAGGIAVQPTAASRGAQAAVLAAAGVLPLGLSRL